MNNDYLVGPGRPKALVCLLSAIVAFGLAVPVAASAWTVTVHVHGAGTIAEVDNRFGDNLNQTNCTIGPDGKSNSSTTDCVGGSANGLYNSGNVVRLAPSVSATASARGWFFDHWTDSSASGQVNCDPQNTTGDFSSPTYCEFQIFENLQTTAVFKDLTGPEDTVISGGPAQSSTTSSTSVQFTSFSAASDSDATFQCRLDPPGSTGSYGACAKNGATFNNLTQNGTWQLNVRAVDPSGNVDTTPAVRSWVVDTVPPNTFIDSGPDGPTNDSTPTFTFHSTDGTIHCSLDGVSVSCSSGTFTPSPALAEGQHTFSVAATDAVGNTDSSPASATFTVDTLAPDTAIDSGPDGPTKDSTPTFGFHSTEGSSTFTCSIDGGNATPCNAGTFTPPGLLSQGQHTFAVFATDAAHNADGSAATRTFTVDTQAPTVSITQHPKATIKTRKRTVRVPFSFQSSEEGTFACKVDNKDPAPCTSPQSYKVGKGRHTFAVTATDSAGNLSTPATFAFTVKKTHH